jgi:hypothetical protein
MMEERRRARRHASVAAFSPKVSRVDAFDTEDYVLEWMVANLFMDAELVFRILGGLSRAAQSGFGSTAFWWATWTGALPLPITSVS